jgi:PAS domain S-box-containing protein
LADVLAGVAMQCGRILVIEDQRGEAVGLRDRLLSLGYDVAAMACSVEEGIDRALELRPDLVLMKLRLDGAPDPFELADRFEAQLRLPVVLFGPADVALPQGARGAGHHELVVNPSDRQQLQSALDRAFDRHSKASAVSAALKDLKRVFASMAEGVIVTDTAGVVRYMNQAASQILECDQHGSTGRPLPEAMRLTPPGTAVNLALRTVAEGQALTLTAHVMPFGESRRRMVDLSVAPVCDVDGSTCGAVITFRDITERAATEAHHSQQHQLEAMRRLAGGVAHEFNNLLTVIVGHTELMRGITNEEARLSSLETISKAVEQAAGLTRELLAFSQSQHLRPQIVHVNALVENVAVLLASGGDQVEIVQRINAEPDVVKADAEQTRQALIEVLRNAMELTSGTTLVVRTANAELDEAFCARNVDVSPGSYVMIEIREPSDTPAEDSRTHLFEPFLTSRTSTRCTGLGLAAAYGIIKQSGGHVWVRSNAGASTILRIYLPRYEPAVEVARHTHRVISAGTEGILVLHEDGAIRQVIREMLGSQGYVVFEAAGLAEALEFCVAQPDRFELLITDVTLQTTPGRQAALEIRRLAPAARVLYTSVFSPYALIRYGAVEADAAVIQRPFSPETLARKVRELLDRART